MISICIPIFNYNVTSLMDKLDYLSKTSGIECEILVADDGSAANFRAINQARADALSIRYIALEKNIGRSAIRNLLNREALYENVIFLDCDSEIINNDFILNYKPYLNQKIVVYGGRIYQDKAPEKDFYLHWKYGHHRETKPVSVRNSFPTGYFQSNNFLISKEILAQLPFNENLKKYGHEDTLMGIEFSRKNIQVVHINNPVLHAGLESGRIFMDKTRAGLRNLQYIYYSSDVDKKALCKHIRILKVFSLIEKYNLKGLMKIMWHIASPLWLFFVYKFFNLKAFDIYKLGFLCAINKSQEPKTN